MDKDVHRTDRQQPFFSESRSHNTKQLRNILLTYVQYNHDLGYCQVSMPCCCISVAYGTTSVLSRSPSCTAATAVHALLLQITGMWQCKFAVAFIVMHRNDCCACKSQFVDPQSVHSQLVGANLTI